jgi:mRNA interferase MazF
MRMRLPISDGAACRLGAWTLAWPIANLPAAGLNQPCLVRLKLFTLHERLVPGTVGSLVSEDRVGVVANRRALLPTGG